MKCTLTEIRNKEIVNIRTGTKLGFADDIEFDTVDCSVKALIIYGRYRFFGLFGRDDSMIIKCKDVEIIGTDTILVSIDEHNCTKNDASKVKILYK